MRMSEGFWIPLSRWRMATVVPYFAAMALRLSPAFTVYVLVAGGSVGAPTGPDGGGVAAAVVLGSGPVSTAADVGAGVTSTLGAMDGVTAGLGVGVARRALAGPDPDRARTTAASARTMRTTSPA